MTARSGVDEGESVEIRGCFDGRTDERHYWTEKSLDFSHGPAAPAQTLRFGELFDSAWLEDSRPIVTANLFCGLGVRGQGN